MGLHHCPQRNPDYYRYTYFRICRLNLRHTCTDHKTMLTLILPPLIAVVLSLVGYVLQLPRKTPHGESPYECGFIATEGQI